VNNCESNIDVAVSSIPPRVLSNRFGKRRLNVILPALGIFLSASLCTAQAGALESADIPAFGNESGYVESFSFGSWNGNFPESHFPRVVTPEFVIPYAVGLGLSDINGPGYTFQNGERRSLAFGSAIIGDQTKRYGPFDYRAGFGKSYAGDANCEGSAAAENSVSAPVPEPETYAMMLVGLGLLGFSVRRRKSDTFN
jgi:hypothetical protein